jgi:hypothetical protein
MAKQTTSPVKFKYSRAVKKGRTSKYKGNEKYRQEDEFYNDASSRMSASSMVSGNILRKTINSYRHWYKFLQLALELEQQDAVLIYKKKEHKIEVDRSMYGGWDIDKIVSKNFDTWFLKENHKELFITDISKVLSSKDKVSRDENKVTIEFDRTRRLQDIIKELKRINSEQDLFSGQSDGTKSQYTINGRVIDSVLQNRYNALVLKLEGKMTNKEILTSEHQYIRATSKSQKGYAIQRIEDGTSAENQAYDDRSLTEQRVFADEPLIFDGGIKAEPNWAYTIHELINGSTSTLGAKQILLSVADGYFLKHPTKTYL